MICKNQNRKIKGASSITKASEQRKLLYQENSKLNYITYIKPAYMDEAGR